MVTLPASSRSWIFPGVMFRIFAFEWTPSVTMPACAPVSDAAGMSIDCSAMASRAMVVCSPVESSMSISRSLGTDMSDLAMSMRLSVTPLIAETTTTTWSPRWRYSATRLATLRMRSMSATDDPPNFCTINAIGKCPGWGRSEETA